VSSKTHGGVDLTQINQGKMQFCWKSWNWFKYNWHDKMLTCSGEKFMTNFSAFRKRGTFCKNKIVKTSKII